MRNKPHEAVQGREFLMMERKAEWVDLVAKITECLTTSTKSRSCQAKSSAENKVCEQGHEGGL